MNFDIQGLRARLPIGPNNHNPDTKVEGNKASTPSSDSAARVATSDTLSLTDQLTQLKTLESQIADLSVVDQQRVPEIRQAIEAGSHNINPTKVATKLLDFELRFSSGR